MNKDNAFTQLNRLAGKWQTEGSTPASGTKVSGTDTYEWLPGKFFMLHTVDVMMGDDRNQTTEIIGYDAEQNVYTMQHYDNKGSSGFMTGTYDNEVWTFIGEGLRFTGGFKNSDHEFSGVWEQLNDDKQWSPFIHIKLTKMEATGQ